MTAKLRVTLFIACIGLFASCKKTGTATTDPALTKKAKYLSGIIHVNGGNTDFTDYTYTGDKRLSTVKLGATATLTYAYTDDKLTSIDTRATNGTDQIRNYYEFVYSGGNPLSATRKVFVNNVQTKDYTFDYVLSGGQVTEVHQNPGAVTTLYTYANGNPGSAVVNGTNSSAYTYDDKKSKFINLPAKFLNGVEGDDRYSANNVLTSNINGVKTTYTYTYDDDGYPTAATTERDKYTYMYITFD